MDLEDLAKRIRDACLEAILQAYEDAGVQGLCAEGRWEAAVGALRTIDLAPLLREFQHRQEIDQTFNPTEGRLCRLKKKQ